MKTVLIVCLSLGLALVNGCRAPQRGITVGLPYCFVEESPDAQVAEQIGHIKSIDIDQVLLFPVVKHGVIRGKAVVKAVGSPVLYKPGTDVECIKFNGVDQWPQKRYMAWVRGYYLEGVPRLFLYDDIVFDRQCYLVPRTPIKPGTDRRKMEEAIINELRKGMIIAENPAALKTNLNYRSLITAVEIESWIVHPLTGFRRPIILWGTPGEKVEIMLTEEDFKLIESYLRTEETKPPAN